MTTKEAILMETHRVKTNLNRARRVISKDPIEQLHIQGAIDFYLTELNQLNNSLKYALLQESKY